MALPKVGVQLVVEDASSVYQELDAFQRALDKLGQGGGGFSNLGKGFDDTGAAANRAADEVNKTGDAARSASGGFNALEEVARGAMQRIGQIATETALQVGEMAVGFAVESVNAAGDFEAAVNNLAAVSGDALAQAGFGFEDVSAKALQLGQDTAYSAQQGISAMTELVKGGVPVAEVMGQATDATLALAAASGTDLAAAAEIVAKQFGVWSSTGITTTQISDLLTQAANASTVGVEELALGLANVGGTAKTAGVEFQDLVQGMALIAPNFSSAADAGTSFKTFISRLVPTTDPATQAMQELGLYTAEAGSVFYDAQGSFVGMEEAARLLNTATAGLSEEQKLLAFNTIFGADAIRAAAAIAESGAEGFNGMGEAMAAAGGAMDTAAIQNQGFNFALESLGGSVETLQIVLGTALLPILTTLIGYVTEGVNQVTLFAQAISGGGASVEGLAAPLATAVPIIQGLVSAFTEAGPGSAAFQEALGEISPLLPPLVAGIGQAASFLQNNWQPALAAAGGILAAILVPALASAAVAFGAAIVAAAPIIAVFAGVGAAAVALYNVWNQNIGGVQQATQTALSGVQAIVQTVIGGITTFWQQNGASILSFAQTTWATIQEIIGGVLSIVLAVVNMTLSNILTFWQNNGATIQAYVTTAWNFISSTITNVLTVIKGVVQTVLAAIQGDWDGVLNGLKTIAGGVMDQLKNIFTNGLELVKTAFNLGLEAVRQFLLNFVGDATGLGGDIINGIIDGIQGGVGALVDAVTGAASRALDAAKAFLGIASPSKVFADVVGEPISAGIGEGIEQGEPIAYQAVRELGGGLLTTAQPIPLELMRVGQKAAAEFGRGFEISAAGAIQTAITSGQEVSAGIAQGIEQSAGEAEAAAERLAAAIEKATKAKLEISSPSGLFAREAGEPVVTGFAQGIMDNLGVLLDAAAEMGNAVLEEAKGFAATIEEAVGPLLRDAFQGAADFAGAQLDALDIFDRLNPEKQRKEIDKIGVSLAKLSQKRNELLAKGGVDFKEIQKIEAEEAALRQQQDTRLAVYTEQKRIADQAQKDIQAAQAKALTISDPAERAAYLKQAVNSIEMLAKARQEAAAATTSHEKAVAAERIRLTEEQIKFQTLLYEQEAKERKAAQEAAIRDAQDALKQLGSLVYFSQEDVFGAGNDAIRGLTNGMLAGLTQLRTVIGGEMNATLAYLKTLLGIASPSKLYADAIGMPLGLGIVAGAQQGLQTMGKAIGADLIQIGSTTGKTVQPAASASQMARAAASASTTNHWTYAPTYQGGAPAAEQNFATLQLLATR